jgi:Lipocalin-like domain
MTNRRFVLGACVAIALGAASLLGVAAAQQSSIKDQLVGTWMLVSVVNEAADGSKSEGFGSNPKGVIIFANDGHFSLFQSRAEVPKIAASDRAKATPEEAMAIVAAAIAYYGTFSVSDDKTISVKINASTFANVAGGSEQKRIITGLTADELKFTNPRTPAGVTLHTVWKRAKPP